MIDICYVISHGFAARMLLQTRLIEQLTERGKKIAIITLDKEDENLDVFRDNPNVFLYTSEEHTTIWDDNYNFKRKYFLEDIKANTALLEKHYHSLFYSKSKHPWKRIRPLYYYLIYLLIKIFPSIRTRFKKKESQYLVSEPVEALIKKINPKLIVATYPVHILEAKVLYAAKAQGIPTLLHLLSWDNITSKGIFPVTADYFIVWGQVMYDELKAYYNIADKFIQICGVPHFDNHIKVKEQNNYKGFIEELGLKGEQPYLFVAMSAPRFAPKEIDIVEWLANAIETDVFGKELQLIVRPHPQNVQGNMADVSWLKRLDALKSNRVAIDYPRLVNSKVRWSMKKEDMNRLSNILLGCSVCINSGSTVSIDALMLDKPVILTSFNGEHNLTYWHSAKRLLDYTHLKKFVKLGGAEPVFGFSHFERLIKNYLEDSTLNLDKRQHALQMQCFKNDGKSTQRVIVAMESILDEVTKKEAYPS